MKNLPLGELLKNLGYISEYQLREVLEYQKVHTHLRIGAALIELGFITEKQLMQTLAQQLELKVAEVERLSIDIEAVQLIPRQLAEKYVILGVKVNANVLTIVTSDPLNFYALEDIRQITEKTLDVQIGESAPLKKSIEYYYSEVTPGEPCKRRTKPRWWMPVNFYRKPWSLPMLKPAMLPPFA
jgi:type IV pilus assembly protein PilB